MSSSEKQTLINQGEETSSYPSHHSVYPTSYSSDSDSYTSSYVQRITGQFIPKYLSSGTYGCVFKPAITCKEDAKMAYKMLDRITKVFYREADFEQEVKISKFVQQRIDKDNYFTLKMFKTCDIPTSWIDDSQVQKCKKFRDAKYTIQYEYGGKDLFMIDYTQIDIVSLLSSIDTILYGIEQLGKRGYAHMDIKPDNIVYDSNKGKMSLIDFGLIKSHEKLMSVPSTLSIMTHRSIIYPPEFGLMSSYYLKNSAMAKRDDDLIKNPYRNSTIFVSMLKDVIKNSRFVYTNNRIKEKLYKIIEDHRTHNKAPNYDNIQYYAPDKIDVYCFGITLIMVISRLPFYPGSVTTITRILDLASRMVKFMPQTRFTPIEARKYFRKEVYPHLEKDLIKTRYKLL